MSKTSVSNKAKKAETKLAVEEKETKKVSPRKASDKAKKPTAEVIPEVKEISAETAPTEESVASADVVVKTKAAKVRGKKYQAAKKKVDVLKYYPLKEAVKLVKETSLSKFDGKVEAHLTVLDIGNVGEIVFPHLETSAKKIVVLNDAVLAEIKDGKTNFDILIATPVTMPKLLPFARILGPRGLMPNPKNGTLTDNPEAAVKKLSVAKTVIRTEKKAPVVHIVVGRVSQPEAELIDNIQELIKVVKKLALSPTMGPSVKVEVIK